MPLVMNNRKGTLREFLAAISLDRDEVLADNPPGEQLKSASVSTTRTILQPSCISKEGVSLTLPSLNALKRKSASEETSFAKAVLKFALKAGNPFPAKSSLAKKCTSSPNQLSSNMCEDKSDDNQIKKSISQIIQCDIKSASNDSGETIDTFSDAINTMSSNLNSTIERLFHAQLAALIATLGRKSIYGNEGHIPVDLAKVLAGSTPSPSNLYTEESDQMTVLNALEKWEQLDETFVPVKNFSSGEDDAKSVAQSLNGEHISQDYPAPSASSLKDNDDQKTASDALKNMEQPDKTIVPVKRFSPVEDDDKLVAQSLNDDQTRVAPPQDYPLRAIKKEEGHAVKQTVCNSSDDETTSSAPTKDSLGHVATITSIYSGSPEDSLRSMIKANTVEKSRHAIQVSLGKSSATFSLDDEQGSPGGIAEKDHCVMAITLTVKVAAKIAGDNHGLEFRSPGSISGKFGDGKSSLKAVEVKLDTKMFFEQIIRQINKAIKNYVSNQKDIKKKIPQPRKTSRLSARSNMQSAAQVNEERTKNAQLLSAFGASAKMNQTTMNGMPNGMPHLAPTNTHSKRNRDSMESRYPEQMGLTRPLHRHSLGGGMPTAEGPSEGSRMGRRTSLQRFSGVPQPDMDTLFRQQQQPMSDLDVTLETLRRGSANGESNGALAEAIRLAESDAYRTMRRSGGNSMAAAAEAVRRAEAENRLQSLQGFSQMNSNSNGNYNGGSDLDAAITAAALNTRRQSYSNNSYSQNAQDAARMADLEAAINGFSGNGSFNMSAEAFQMAELETEMRRRGSRMNSNSIAANNNSVSLAEMQSVMRYGGRNNSMAAAAEVVRLAEMGSSMSRGSRPGDSMAAAADSVRLAEMESSMRRGSRQGNPMAAAAEAVRFAEMEGERRHNSNFTETMRLAEMDAIRRNGRGTSMQSHGYVGQSESSLFQNESLDNLAALMRRRGGHNDPMATDVDNVSMAELERWNRLNNNGPAGSNTMSVAAEAASLAEMEHELARQLLGNSQGIPNDLSNSMSVGMRNSNGRRVSFGPDTSRPDTFHEQLRRFQR